MSTNYVESSLKRFLKRKMKVTLGLIVAFMITGTVGFAETVKDNWLEGIGTKKELKNIDKTIEIDTDKAISIKTENGVLTILYPEDKKIEILSTEISNKILENINNTIKLGNNAYNPKNLGLILQDDNGNFGKGFAYVNNTGDTFKALNPNEVSVIENNTTQSNEIFVVKENDQNIFYAGQHAENGGIIINKGIIEVKKIKDATHIFGQSVIDGIAYNYGIIKNNGMIGQRIKNGIGYNYGIIANNGSFGQYSIANDSLFNYGIIANNEKYGQRIKNGIGYNYGIIANNGSFGQETYLDTYNYGIIANNGEYGQYGQVGTKNIINCGTIANNGSFGQFGVNTKNIINYGIIANKGDSGQHGNTATIINYGIIANTGKCGQVISKNVKGYNYGIVANDNLDGTAKDIAGIYSNGDAYNYGIVINKKGYGISGYVENNGIIFVTEEGKTGIYNTNTEKNKNNGVNIIKNETGKGVGNNKKTEDYGVEVNAKNPDAITISKAGEKDVDGKVMMLVATNQKDSVITDENTFKGTLGEGQNLFADRYTTNSKLIETVKLKNDTLTNNHITTVVGNDDRTDAPILTKEGDLTLNNSSIVGYFEKNGTLLEINGNLTLTGESVINAIAGNEYTGYNNGNALDDVTAVKLAENGVLAIEENSKVLGAVKGNGTLVYENSEEFHSNTQEVDSLLVRTTTGKTTDVSFANVTLKDSGKGIENAGKFIINNNSDILLKDKETSTSITLANNINIEKGIDGSSSAYGVELILGDGQNSTDGTIKIGTEENNLGIDLGAGDDTVIIRNKADIAGTINTADGDDTVVLENLNGNHDTFDYKLANVENLDLNNQTWKIGNNAGFETTTTIQNGTLRTDLTFDIDSDRAVFENSNAKDILSNAQFGEKGNLQFGIGKGSELEVGAEYTVDYNKVNEDYVKVSAIFDKTGTDKLTVKDAEDMGVNSKYSILYDKMLDNAGNSEEILDILNNSDAATIAAAINKRGTLGETLATTGYKITRDISNSFMSAVNEWDKKANKGEWLANAKYINSDVEYDGANSVKGYDSDINSMIGMIEYGVSDRTAYGIALGGGETEVNVDGAGQLEGDNYYIGAYAKHSVNGFDLVGNLGYTISELEVNGEGSADSSAITLGAYVKRNIALTDTVRLEPNAAFTYDYIMQDNAEGSGVKVDNKDIHVFEAAAGMNIVKSFALEKGLFEMKAGVKYSMADVNRNEETIISTFGVNGINLGSPDIDKARGTAHIGFDFEHTTGFGVNGKYETMWSDSGDDSRITAGISYRF